MNSLKKLLVMKVILDDRCEQRLLKIRDCGMAKSSKPIKWQDSNTPTLTPYKAFSGALLL